MKSIVLLFFISFIFSLYGNTPRKVDFRYAPSWHVTSICLPDDSCKTLVAPEGQLLYDFGFRDTESQKNRLAANGKGGLKYFPYANGVGFQTVFHILADENIKFTNQKLYSASVPIVETYSETQLLEVKQESFSYTSFGLEKFDDNNILKNRELTPREDIILTTVTNKQNKEQYFYPKIIVNSEYPITFKENYIEINKEKKLYISNKVSEVRQNLGENKIIVELEPILLKANETKMFANLYDNGINTDLKKLFLESYNDLNNKLKIIRDQVILYWENHSSVPKNNIYIPDPDIQNLVDASIRNIWQAREIVDQKINFQVGPTCYRGLWIVDGAFLLETATILNKGEDARSGIEYMLSFQQPNGKFGKLKPNYWKENGIVLWTCVRHAKLTQDKDWLQSIWPKLKKTVNFIKEMRTMTLNNDILLDDGLIPPGEIDGGLGGADDKAEYTNVYWNLLGLKAMVNAARWLNIKEDLKDFEDEYKDFYKYFKKAANRDLQTDMYGNKYLPIPMDSKYYSLPQRAQWAFCHGVYPGQIFETDDPIANGTLEMLHTTLHEGMVMGTGWIIDGIWNYFASFYGHACIWLGDGERAANSLYAFANHASPLFAWREEHNPRDLPMHFVGDMPHNWASAEFIRLVIHLIAIDRGDELHLFEGLPKEWTQPGMVTSLKEVATPFGKLTFSLKVDNSGKEAILEIDKISDSSCKKIVIHKSGWALIDESSIIELDPAKNHNIKISIR